MTPVVQHTTLVQDRCDGTGVTFGGAGRPMDLDKAHSEGRCFRCGEKGHLACNCPKPRQQTVRSLEVNPESNDRGAQSTTTSIRQMFSSLDTEQRAALARELGFVLTPQ